MDSKSRPSICNGTQTDASNYKRVARGEGCEDKTPSEEPSELCEVTILGELCEATILGELCEVTILGELCDVTLRR